MLRALALVAWLIASAAVAQSPFGRPMLDSVGVSRRALTISFPLDTSAAVAKGGGPAWQPDVSVLQDIRQPSMWLRLKLAKPLNAATYRSALRPVSCEVLTDAYSCRDSASVEIRSNRVVVTIRDSAMLALLFMFRPSKVHVITDVRPPGLGGQVVRYDDPQLLPPSKEALAEYDLAQGRERWRPWSRFLATETYGAADTTWMQVGDTTTATVVEMQSRDIDSMNSRSDFTASGWTSSDSSAVALTSSSSKEHPVAVMLVALRPGRSTIAAHGLRGASDDLPRSRPVRTLTKQIVVTNRLARVEISPRPTTIVAGSAFPLTARAIDINGAAVAEVPVNFYVIYDIPEQYGWDGKRYGLAANADLTKPGRLRFIARFAKLADTLDVRVVPRSDTAGTAASSPQAILIEGMSVVDSLYSGYGESSGSGVRQGRQGPLANGGNRYVDREYPLLDRIKRVTVVEVKR